MGFTKGFDWSILLLVLLIGILGSFLISSLVPRLLFPQLISFLIGFVFLFLFSHVDFRMYRHLVWFFYSGSLVFLVLTFIFGEVSRGSVRWLQIGQFTIQSSEIVKPFLLVFFSFFFAQENIKISRILLGVVLFLIPALLIFQQPDLGSAFVLGTGLFGVLLYSLPMVYLLIGGLSLTMLFPVVWFLLAGYQKQRIFNFLNPGLDPLGSGYNLIQAMISVGSGQFFGRGWGKGTQSHLLFLPEQHTDFIFAAFVEEMGLIGSLVLVALYVLLLWRILRVVKLTTIDSARLFSVSVFLMLLFQVFINIGMNLGIAPITGITLPFFSYGGSSIVALMICLGMIESINRLQKRRDVIEIR